MANATRSAGRDIGEGINNVANAINNNANANSSAGRDIVKSDEGQEFSMSTRKQ